MRHKLPLILLMLVSLLVAFQPAVTAQDQKPTPSDDEVNRLAKQMYCPVCENTPLDVCPTQACSEWRELIRLRLSEGWSDEQIKQYFSDQYGYRVLAEPPRKGLNWLLYILPVVFFGIGAVVLWKVLSGMSTKGRMKAAEATRHDVSEDDRYLKELEEELKKNN